MKRIVLFVVLLISINSIAQTFTPRTNGTFTPVDPYLSVPRAFYLPKVCDTLVDPFHGGKDSVGAAIWDTCSHRLWIRDVVGTQKYWKLIGNFTIANNGLSSKIDSVQFGQLVGAVGDPALLNTNREIPTNGFSVLFTGTGRVAIGTTTPNSTHKFTAIATGSDRAIQATAVNGVALNASSTGNAIFGQSTGTSISVQGATVGAGIGVQGSAGVGGIGGKFKSIAQGGDADPISLEIQRDGTGIGVSNGVGQTIMFRLPFTNATQGNESGRITNSFSNAVSGAQSSNFGFHLVDNAVSSRKALLASTGQWTWDGYSTLTAQIDTVTYKPIAIDGSGNVVKMGGWIGSGGAGFSGNNVGIGYRWLATPAGDFKTSFAGYGILKDSSSNTNGITDKVDTTTLKNVYLPLTLNNAKTVNQAGNNIIFTGGGKPVTDSILYTHAYINPIIGLDSAVFNGNSITYGGLATTPDSSYAARTSKFIGLRMVNIAVSGTTVFQICSRSLNYINPGHNSMHFMCAGFNDIRTVAASANVYNAIGSAYEASLINHCMESYTSGSDCNLYGSWTTNFNANTAAGGKTTEAAYSSTTNDSLTVDVTGTNVYIGLIGIYTNNKIGNIYIDGVQVDAVSTSNQTYGTGYQSMGKYYTGLSAGTHHVKIVVGTGSNFLMVDYIGSGSSSTKPFVFIHIPKMDATGYSGGFSTDAITNTANDTLTARYNRALAAGLNVYLAQTNNFYIATTSSGLASDHIHPNDLGHYQIFSAIRTAINSVRATPGLLVNSNDGYFYGGGLDGYLKQFAYTTEITLQKVLNNSSYLPVSNYISGPGNLEFNGFNQIKLNKLRISNSITATFDGIFQIRSANGGFYILNRDLDTTKGFGFYCNGNILRVTDGYNNTDIIKIDTSFRTLFRNNKLGGLAAATATVNIEGNITGAVGRASLKIDSGALLSVPEKYAIEVNGSDIYWTDRTGARATLSNQTSKTSNIPGTATNDDATTGNLGENIESYVTTYTNYSTTATYQNIASITLTPGNWEINAFGTFYSNGATITAGNDAIFLIGTVTASATGAVEGKSFAYIPQAALLGTSHESVTIPSYRVKLTSTTTYYFNTQATFTVGNPQFVGGIKASRPR